MIERRKSVRDKVIYGGIAEIDGRGATRPCVVRNLSEQGASLEFGDPAPPPKQPIGLTIARKGRSFLARVVWWRDNFVGVAFTDSPVEAPFSDLEARLRRSEKKKRELQHRIKQLIGED
jgi:hypothetical protein